MVLRPGGSSRRRGRAEVAPAGMEALGTADVARIEPQRRHVDADDKARPDRRQHEPRHEALFARLAEGEDEGRDRHRDHQHREHPARTPPAARHAHEDARRNGQRAVGAGEEADVVARQPVGGGQHGTRRRRHVEPDAEADEEGNPGRVQRADLAVPETEDVGNLRRMSLGDSVASAPAFWRAYRSRSIPSAPAVALPKSSMTEIKVTSGFSGPSSALTVSSAIRALRERSQTSMVGTARSDASSTGSGPGRDSSRAGNTNRIKRKQTAGAIRARFVQWRCSTLRMRGDATIRVAGPG